MVRWIAIILLVLFVAFNKYSYSDVTQAIGYYGAKISEAHPTFGSAVVIVGIVFILFTDNIFTLFKKVRAKSKKIKAK